MISLLGTDKILKMYHVIHNPKSTENINSIIHRKMSKHSLRSRVTQPGITDDWKPSSFGDIVFIQHFTLLMSAFLIMIET